MGAEHLGRVDQLLHEQGKFLELRLEQDDARGFQMRRAVRYAEGVARDHFGLDREAPRLQGEPVMIGVEAEAFALAVAVVDADEPFAAEVEIEAGALERPVGAGR